MKTIYRIAKSELNSLFCSPIAWLVLVIFTFQLSMVFTDRIIWELKDFVVNNRERDGLTVYFLLSGFGTPLFPGVLSYLYLYFPLLTMGLMSRNSVVVRSSYCILPRLPVPKSCWVSSFP